ncbi:hypothetical protein ES705_03379 [subsurface metagenome]
MLETKVYVDTTPLLWTNIRIEVTGEVARQIPGLASIMERKQDYKKSEIQHLERFLKGG